MDETKMSPKDGSRGRSLKGSVDGRKESKDRDEKPPKEKKRSRSRSGVKHKKRSRSRSKAKHKKRSRSRSRAKHKKRSRSRSRAKHKKGSKSKSGGKHKKRKRSGGKHKKRSHADKRKESHPAEAVAVADCRVEDNGGQKSKAVEKANSEKEKKTRNAMRSSSPAKSICADGDLSWAKRSPSPRGKRSPSRRAKSLSRARAKRSPSRIYKRKSKSRTPVKASRGGARSLSRPVKREGRPASTDRGKSKRSGQRRGSQRRSRSRQRSRSAKRGNHVYPSRSRDVRSRRRSLSRRNRSPSFKHKRRISRSKERNDRVESFYKDRIASAVESKDWAFGKSWGVQPGVWSKTDSISTKPVSLGQLRPGGTPSKSWDPTKARNRDLEAEVQERDGMGKAWRRPSMSMMHDDRNSHTYRGPTRPSPGRWSHDKFGV